MQRRGALGDEARVDLGQHQPSLRAVKLLRDYGAWLARFGKLGEADRTFVRVQLDAAYGRHDESKIVVAAR